MTEVLRARVITADGLLERGVVAIEHGRFTAVEADFGRYQVTEDLAGCYLAPGLIDVHTHGIAGADTMDGTRESLAVLSRRYAAHGVTGFLPTTMTQDLDRTVGAIMAARSFMAAQQADGPAGALVLGLHLEGPWLTSAYKGAQNGDYLIDPEVESVWRLVEAGAGQIKIVSMAPELPGAAEAIALLRRQGIAVSLGHTAAVYEVLAQAVALGAAQVTHCFNAMPQLHHRQPGPVGAALLFDELTTELIADGLHVHPAVMRLLLRVKGRDRVMAVTDSMSATELADGLYDLGGQPVMVRAGEARLESGALAGSTLTLDRAVRNLVDLCELSLPDAVYVAATVPARAIGLGHSKGRVVPGYDADYCLLDEHLLPVRTVVGGQTVWQAAGA
jgi:N-acetylglucosamine-6-phosphate deacetylase